MNGSFRQSMSWLHTWGGLVLGWVLYFIFVTGSTGYFDTEIDRWMQPEIPSIPSHADSPDHTAMLALATQRLQQVAPNGERWQIFLPVERQPLLKIRWTDAQGKDGDEILQPQNGQPINVRDTGGGQQLYRMHWLLHYLPDGLTRWIVSLCSMFMLVALISGIVIHKKIFKDFFTFRSGKKQRAWLDIHNLFSVLPLPFHLMITYSGLIFLMFTTFPALIGASYGIGEDDWQRFIDEAFTSFPTALAPAGIAAPLTSLPALITDVEARWDKEQITSLSIDYPADANAHITIRERLSGRLSDPQQLTYHGVSGVLLHIKDSDQASGTLLFYDVMINLHEGLFAETILRWLYFFSGLMGAGMIATGTILWAAKRHAQTKKNGSASKGLRLVEYLNVGTIVGLPIAIAVYFWANRLLPVEMAERADWEVHALFITWATMLVYPLFRVKRPLSQPWIEQLTLAAILYALLPAINALTTNKHLGMTLAQGDWVLAGFDLSMLCIAACFALAAYKVRCKQNRQPALTKSEKQ